MLERWLPDGSPSFILGVEKALSDCFQYQRDLEVTRGRIHEYMESALVSIPRNNWRSDLEHGVLPKAYEKWYDRKSMPEGYSEDSMLAWVNQMLVRLDRQLGVPGSRMSFVLKNSCNPYVVIETTHSQPSTTNDMLFKVFCLDTAAYEELLTREKSCAVNGMRFDFDMRELSEARKAFIGYA